MMLASAPRAETASFVAQFAEERLPDARKRDVTEVLGRSPVQSLRGHVWPVSIWWVRLEPAHQSAIGGG